MNSKLINNFVCTAICLIFIYSNKVSAQNQNKRGAGEVSEIIIPTSANITNNFNLFYEIHLSREGIPSPSFWYKIIFSKACSFEFTLIPFSEDDAYDFYFFKIESNYDFCTAVSEEKIISCNASRVQKVYTDREQSEKFRTGLVDIKPIQVKAGDAIYIEVFSTKGNDCGHILDFRTTENSFVVKIVNDNCSGNKATDTINVGKYNPLVIDEKQAMGIFSNTLCPPNKKAIFISSIQIDDRNVKVQKKLDFANYSTAEAPKYINLKTEELNTNHLLPIKQKSLKSDTLQQNRLAVKVPVSDSLAKQNEVLKSRIAALTDTQKVQTNYKSTAELNSISENTCPIYNEVTIVKSDKIKNSTRLEVDKVLFLLLREDLKRKVESTDEQIHNYSKTLKNTSTKDKKEEVILTIKETKTQKLNLQVRLKDTEQKIKKINKLLREERVNKIKPEESVFAKCVNTLDSKKSDSSSAGQGLPLGVIYKVQIGAYKNPVSVDVFKGLNPVFEELFSGGVKYSAGAFTHYIDAQHAKDYIRTMGLTDSFVVAYHNGKRITIEEAKRMEIQ